MTKRIEQVTIQECLQGLHTLYKQLIALDVAKKQEELFNDRLLDAHRAKSIVSLPDEISTEKLARISKKLTAEL